MTECRSTIVRAYGRWTALSALRSGCPVKSGAVVYRLLDGVPFTAVLEGGKEITSGVFDRWHEAAVAGIQQAEPRWSAGWAAKILNVYLKTVGYIGREGRPGLERVLHPPVDGGLWRGLARRFAHRPDILALTHSVTTIGGIATYPQYSTIIEGCRMAAGESSCALIEVEQFWEGSQTPQ